MCTRLLLAARMTRRVHATRLQEQLQQAVYRMRHRQLCLGALKWLQLQVARWEACSCKGHQAVDGHVAAVNDNRRQAAAHPRALHACAAHLGERRLGR